MCYRVTDITIDVTQAYMYLLLGKLHTERKEYEHAMRLFERARAWVQHGQNRLPFVVSLVISPGRFSTTCRNRSRSLLTDVGMEI